MAGAHANDRSPPRPIFNFDDVPTVVGGTVRVQRARRAARDLQARRGGTAETARRSNGLREKRSLTDAERPRLANKTIGGETARCDPQRAKRGDESKLFVVVPQARPRFGNVIYDDAVRDSAQVRIDLALEFMRDEGIQGAGEVGDVDPMNAAKDAIAEFRIDEIIVSTLPPSPRAGCGGTCRSACTRRPGCRSSTSWWTSWPTACRSTSRSCSPTAPRPRASWSTTYKKLADERPAPVHRRRAAVLRARPRGGRGARPPAQAAGLAARGGDRRRRDDRRPGSLHGGA